jgi:hypothetical protein
MQAVRFVGTCRVVPDRVRIFLQIPRKTANVVAPDFSGRGRFRPRLPAITSKRRRVLNPRFLIRANPCPSVVLKFVNLLPKLVNPRKSYIANRYIHLKPDI